MDAWNESCSNFKTAAMEAGLAQVKSVVKRYAAVALATVLAGTGR